MQHGQLRFAVISHQVSPGGTRTAVLNGSDRLLRNSCVASLFLIIIGLAMAAGRSSRELSTRAAQSARERVVAVVPVVVECYPVPPPRSDCVCVCVCVCTYHSRSRREKKKKKKKNVLIEARRRRAPRDKDWKKNEGCCLEQSLD